MSDIHLCIGTGTHYRIRTLGRGCRKWTPLGGRFKTLNGAARRLADAMAKRYWIKRGEILLCADWYDPQVILETIRP